MIPCYGYMSKYSFFIFHWIEYTNLSPTLYLLDNNRENILYIREEGVSQKAASICPYFVINGYVWYQRDIYGSEYGSN